MTKVRCFNCGKQVYETTRDVNQGDIIQSEDFKGINGFPDPKDKEVIACPNCGDITGIRLGLEEATGHEVWP